MGTRIDAKFASLKAEGRKAFVAYVMAGDPDFDTSLAVVKGLPCLLYTSPSPRDLSTSRMPSSA